MERKLVKQGRNALTVTLPAKWLRSRGLAAGNSVQVAERDNELVITGQLLASKKEVTVNVKDSERSLVYHLLLGKYIEGYDRIVVLHDNAKLLQEIGQKMLGMVIEEHTPNRTVLKNIIAVPEENFHTILRRAAHIFLQQARTLEMITHKKATIDQLKDEEALLDQNLLYCLRYLNKYDVKQSYRYFLICSMMESAGDQVTIIAKHIGTRKGLAKKIVKGVEDYTNALFTSDLRKLWSTLRAFRSSLSNKTFVDGLAFALAESLYNFIGFVTKDKEHCVKM